ncbi:MAG TPA: D-aminoacyl-tRNA deacylase [Bacteroidia bacterium]|nr:D-aminoacyl-tRNA deacylase [Bacteroidia bacterium]
MRLLIQRVGFTRLRVENRLHAEIGPGALVLIGIRNGDTKSDADYLVKKLIHLRIFPDHENKMNLSLLDCGAELMLVSQFTLYASTKKGNRPSFLDSAKPEAALPLYQYFIEACHLLVPEKVKSGIFGADMNIELLNSGPVSILIDSQEKE